MTGNNRVLIIDENESILVVDSSLVSRVDEKRGEMSRPEYLNSLIDNQLQEPGSPESHSDCVNRDYVDREEFLQFAQRIKELLCSFLEFSLSYGLDIARPPLDPGFQELSQKLQTLSQSEENSAAL